MLLDSKSYQLLLFLGVDMTYSLDFIENIDKLDNKIFNFSQNFHKYITSSWKMMFLKTGQIVGILDEKLKHFPSKHLQNGPVVSIVCEKS